jgi:hypothetical protein
MATPLNAGWRVNAGKIDEVSAIRERRRPGDARRLRRMNTNAAYGYRQSDPFCPRSYSTVL